MSASTTQLRIASATPINAYRPLPISRAVTEREKQLIEQINYLKEELLISEIAMDDKDVEIANLLKNQQTNQQFIGKLEARLKQNHAHDNGVNDKFTQLKTTARKANQIARDRQSQLVALEKELERYQQKTLVSERIKQDLIDLIAKHEMRSSEKSVVSEQTQKPLFVEPKTDLKVEIEPRKLSISAYIKNYFDRFASSITDGFKTKSFSESQSELKDIEASSSKAFIDKLSKSKLANLGLTLKKRNQTSSSFQPKNPIPNQHTQLPAIKWCKSSQSLPVKSGLYYVSDGTKVEIALFNLKQKQFNSTNSNMPIDYWCVAPKKVQ